jgi:hypothetical protein
MVFEVTSPKKFPAAQVTFKKSFSCMDETVQLKVIVMTELLVTFLAHERFRYSLHVGRSPETATFAQGFLTHFTHTWIFKCRKKKMIRKYFSFTKLFTARVA